MAKALSTFYTLVAPHVHGCPEPMLDQALRFAAIEFCRQTNVYQTVESQDLTAGEPNYDLDVPGSTRLSLILGVWVDGAKLGAVSTDDVVSGDAMREDGDVDEGAPSVFYQKIPSVPTISVWPVPTETAELTVRAAFEPTMAAVVVPDVLYDYYANDIAAGAIAYLMELPGQVFSNPVLGRIYTTRFKSAIGRAKPVARAGDVRRSTRVQHRPFA